LEQQGYNPNSATLIASLSPLATPLSDTEQAPTTEKTIESSLSSQQKKDKSTAQITGILNNYMTAYII
jgi:hypothetical protein